MSLKGLVQTTGALVVWLAVAAGLAQAQNAVPVQVPALFTDNCARCHNINGVNAVCPDLSTIGLRRDAAYIRQSILDPNAYIVPGYPMNVMPLNFAQVLKPEEVDTLVKFLLTLKGQTVDPNRPKNAKGS